MLSLPNLLSLCRYALAPAIAFTVVQEHWTLSVLLLWLAITSDLADGIIARGKDNVTTLGGILDHSADAFFVTTLLAALAYQGVVTAFLPVLVVAAFLQYLIDSSSLQGQPLKASFLGRYNGIAYYVLGGWPIMQHSLSLYVFSETILYYLSWGLAVSTLVSMADRMIALLRRRESV